MSSATMSSRLSSGVIDIRSFKEEKQPKTTPAASASKRRADVVYGKQRPARA